jgi:hypothetical protein
MTIPRTEARGSNVARRSILAVAFVLALSGCATGIGGQGSFPLITRARFAGYESVAKVDETRCTHRLLILFNWGEDANHEAIITDVLADHDGDMLVDAELTYRLIPTIVYDQYCARVTGTVARRTGSPRPEATQ